MAVVWLARPSHPNAGCLGLGREFHSLPPVLRLDSLDDKEVKKKYPK